MFSSRLFQGTSRFCFSKSASAKTASQRSFSSNAPILNNQKQSKSSSKFPMRTFAAIATGLAGFAIVFDSMNSSKPKKKTEEQKKNETLAAQVKTKFSSKDTMVVFVLGGPGAGKGTQCQNIVRDYGFVHLSAGDLLRAERNRPNSKYGALINNYIKEGQIVPMEITINLLEQAMEKSVADTGTKRFLIDGFPRKMDQAEAFEKQVCESNIVLYFECPDEEMEKRLLKRGETSGRVDDNLESIRKRFKTFHETSYPVVEHYSKIGKVKKISCLNTPEKVYEDVKIIFDKQLQLLETASA